MEKTKTSTIKKFYRVIYNPTIQKNYLQLQSISLLVIKAEEELLFFFLSFFFSRDLFLNYVSVTCHDGRGRQFSHLVNFKENSALLTLTLLTLTSCGGSGDFLLMTNH